MAANLWLLTQFAKETMKIVDSIDGLNDLEKGWVLTIGNFDGFHVGHQQIIKTAREVADDIGAAGVAVMTFDPHPVQLLRPEHAPGVLTPIGLRTHLLEQQGVGCLIVVKDSFKVLNLSPEGFVDEFLMHKVHPKVVVEGTDFNFGYGRSGDIETLKQIGLERGFGVEGVELHQMQFSEGEDVKVSSSIIREFVERGRVEDAAQALGREYRLIGRSVQGRGVGRRLGFPTANLDPVNQILPAEGVYCGHLQIADSQQGVEVYAERLPAVFSVGRAKTFVTDHPLLLEAHVLIEDELVESGIYDKWLAMDFTCRIRSQQIFESPDELVQQIKKDITFAQDTLGM